MKHTTNKKLSAGDEQPRFWVARVIARFVLSVVPQNMSEWYVLIISFVIGYVFGDIDILLLSWKVLMQKLHLLWNI